MVCLFARTSIEERFFASLRMTTLRYLRSRFSPPDSPVDLKVAKFQKSGSRCRPGCAKIARVSLLKIPASDLPKFRRRLLSWFARRKRDLPWRRTRDPYRIWLSEIMLQQTRVAAVIPYYERFLESFPDAASLARACTDRVLALWAGLGYYSRARNLQRAAQEISARPGGEFPARLRSGARSPGHWPLHSGGGAEHRLRSAPRGAGRKRRARPRPDRRRARRSARHPALAKAGNRGAGIARGSLTRRLEPGHDGIGCDRLHPEISRAAANVLWSNGAARANSASSEEIAVPRAKSARPSTSRSWPPCCSIRAAERCWCASPTATVRYSPACGNFRRSSPRQPGRSANSSSTCMKNSAWTAVRNIPPLRAARHTVTFRNIRLESFLIRVPKLPRVSGARIVALSQVRGLPVSNATQKIADAAIADGIR